MAVRKIERGHYFEDFEVGHLFKHAPGRGYWMMGADRERVTSNQIA
jgi:hypothetical protein